MSPIAPIKDKQGQLMTPPALIPSYEASTEQVLQMVTCNENLKTLITQAQNATDIRAAKASLLPYVTPCGAFTRRSCKDFVSPFHPVIVDMDGLHSYQEAVEMRRMPYDDPLLQPVLTSIDPSELGVKAFVPCHYSSTANDTKNIIESMSWAMRYVETAYNTVATVSSEAKSKVDFFGKDPVRSCFLSYDPEALFRAKQMRIIKHYFIKIKT